MRSPFVYIFDYKVYELDFYHTEIANNMINFLSLYNNPRLSLSISTDGILSATGIVSTIAGAWDLYYFMRFVVRSYRGHFRISVRFAPWVFGSHYLD